MTLPYPNKTIITREQMAALDPNEYLIQRKLDGELCHWIIDVEDSRIVLLGELMRKKSGGLYTPGDLAMFNRLPKSGDWFCAFTVASVDGENWLDKSANDRFHLMLRYWKEFPRAIVVAEWALATTAFDFVESCFKDGAEGVVAHKWDSPWGNMLCCKQGWLGVCRVFGLVPGSQSVFIMDAKDNTPRGKLKVGLKNVRVGSLIRVEALAVHESGALREAKLCTNWLVEY